MRRTGIRKFGKYLLTLSVIGAMVLGNGLMVSASEPKEVKDLFDAEYYRKANPDLAKLYGNNADELYAHFMRYGIYEGRDCTPLFDVDIYKQTYPELVEKYGNDNPKYYEQYLSQGIAEGRESGGLFDAVAYANAYPDLKAVYGNDINGLYQHFLEHGIYEGRLEGLNFNYWCYGALNPELGKAYEDKPQYLYLQYIREGLEQGKEGARTSVEYRYTYCDPDGYGGKDPKHLIRQWTVAQMPEDGKIGYDEAYCEVCGQHFRDEMDMNGYYVRHLHMPEPDYNRWKGNK
ncbi:MAG: hypothetical protein GX234_07260 [Clostridiales bacterium]|nr:hypothetical protein [Clostridiales bacterium]